VDEVAVEFDLAVVMRHRVFDIAEKRGQIWTVYAIDTSDRVVQCFIIQLGRHFSLGHGILPFTRSYITTLHQKTTPLTFFMAFSYPMPPNTLKAFVWRGEPSQGRFTRQQYDV
jgi:hypothetical protein